MWRMRAATLVAVLFLTFAVPAPAHAWGFSAHEFIMDRAIALLPPELRPFFEKNRTEVVYRAIDPDLWRTVGFFEEPPNHFIDIDAYGAYPFAALPRDYDAAVLKFGKDRVIQEGLLPWRAEEEFANLRLDFEAYNRGGEFAAHDIVLFSGVLAHYISDACVPLHAVVNYDGRLTGQSGVHSRWETTMFERYQKQLTIAPKSIAPITSPRDFAFDRVLEGAQLVPALLKADLDAIGSRDVYDDAYYDAFFRAQRSIIEERLNAAIAGVAAAITGAWEAAGKPAVPVNVATPPQRRRRP
jgi:hypothetical protein